MKYKVAVIIPFYNVEKYFDKALQSVVNQTLKSIQVIMVNDGSTDNSIDIANNYVQQYSNFQVINKKNGGAGEARNLALNYVEAEYILFLDSDDQLTPNACQLLVTEADKYKADIVVGRSVWKYPNGEEKPVEYLERWYNKTRGKNQAFNKEIAVGIPIPTSKLFKTKLILDNGIVFPTGITGEDVPFSICTYHHSKGIYIIPEVVYWRTEREETENLSVSQQKSIKIIKDRIKVMEIAGQYCDKNGLDFINEHCKKSTFLYIMRTIDGMDEEDKKEAYVVLFNYIRSTFRDLETVKNYIGMGYSDLRLKAIPEKKIGKSPLYDTFKTITSDKMNKNIKISVILPLYNVEDYLEEAVDSIINQSIGAECIEIILVDDGSKDETGIIMEELCKRYNNVRAIYLGQSSGAAGKPRNVGLEYATGKYIMYLDPDDKYTSKACEKLYNLAEKNKSDICIGKFKLFDSQKQWFKHYFPDYRLYRTTIDKSRELLSLPPSIWSKLYRKDFLVKIGAKYPEGVIAQDAVFNIETLLRARNISYIPEVVALYRIREDEKNKSMTQKLNQRYFKDYIFTRKLIINLYNKYSIYRYMEERMVVDLNFLFKLFIECDFNSVTIQEFVEIIQEYVNLIENKDTNKLTSEKKMFIKLVKQKQYESLLQLKEYSEINYDVVNVKPQQVNYRTIYNKLANSNSWKLTSVLRMLKRKVLQH